MAFDAGLADRIREVLQNEPGLVEKRVFSGLGFMLDGNMCVGIRGDGLIARVPADEFDELLAETGADQFMGSGRPMKGWLTVHPEGIAEDEDLNRWIQRGVSIARSLPPK